MIARIQPFAVLLARLVIGAVFIAHGWQKLNTIGLSDTIADFEGMSVPAPTLATYFTTAIELVGGAALILGLLLPIAGLLLTADMLGALFIVHLSEGFFLPTGYEFVLTLAAASLLLAFSGGGALAIDNKIPGLRVRHIGDHHRYSA